jgi:hypothetical protein
MTPYINKNSDQFDEDKAILRWAQKQQQEDIERDTASIHATVAALGLTQSQLAKRPDLWGFVPINHY